MLVPLKWIAIFAAGIGLSFGLCGLSSHLEYLSSVGTLIFIPSIIGFLSSILWLVVAVIANAIRR